ncbi:hypothetical protein [uncultured Aeromicrobium sp.]|uniref:hypothetical protein n=1 Tax=uncultured Aeromicrobium sp. TaxID=337820 RepID=UPI0025F48E34|nr:hypothetical protein [uncultured Aeromicrobium sp.]
MSNEIATVRGELTLKIGDAEAVSPGFVSIPIEAKTELDYEGQLQLTATPNMREVRELITEVFAASAREEATTE